LLGSFFTYAENQGVRSRGTNPAHDVKPFPEASRERFLKPDEVARLGDALREAEKTGLPIPESLKKKGRGISAKRRAKLTGKKRGPYARKTTPKLQPANPFAVAAIRFLLLTGWREREALTLRWSDLDLDRGLATLPHTKTGKSQRIFGGPARQLLADLPRVKGSPFVFPGKDAESPLVEISRVWYAARAAAGLEDVRLHDLRHSFASVTASGGGSLLLIGKLLGHKNSATTARYAHLLDDPVRAAADTASESLAGWLNASEARKVQPIRSA
jgi:integrase